VPDEADVAYIAADRVMASKGEAVALVISNSEAAAISAEVQRRRCIVGTTPCAQDMYCGVGDRVRTRKNDYRAHVLNGQRWQVAGVHRDGSVTLQGERGAPVTLPAAYVRRYLELDYAMTVDSAQGITVDRAICVLREGTGRSYLYSAATRGRQPPEYVMAGVAQDKAQSALSQIVTTDDLALTAREIADEIKREQAAEWVARLGLAPAEDEPPTQPLRRARQMAPGM